MILGKDGLYIALKAYLLLVKELLTFILEFRRKCYWPCLSNNGHAFVNLSFQIGLNVNADSELSNNYLRSAHIVKTWLIIRSLHPFNLLKILFGSKVPLTGEQKSIVNASALYHHGLDFH